MNQMQYTLGIDIGSTTVKIAILDENHQILFSDYKRHFAYTKLGNITLHPMITGSGGLTLANYLQVPFVQEVIAVSTSLQELAPKTDVAIELGGEDAKIIYFENGNVEQRMNGICAGGTGSFIDQMASLLQTDAAGLNEYAKGYRSLYTIAARCGVFAKSDIQPLINDGATKEDLSASIFQAVVNQTISGLACGKPIRGHVAFLGGPLHFLSELKKAFIRTLNLDDEHIIDTANSHLFAAIGIDRSKIDFILIQEIQRNFFFGTFIIGHRPQEPFLPFTTGHRYVFAGSAIQYFRIVEYSLQVLKPFHFRFSVIERRFVIPEDSLQRTVEHERCCQLVGMSRFQPFVEITDRIVGCTVYHASEGKRDIMSCIGKLFVSANTFLSQ